jgi:hypothetical protein
VRRLIRFPPSPSMAVALCALVLAGTGGAYAAATTSSGGPTTLTQPPGFFPLPGGISNSNVGVNSQETDPYNDEWQKNNVYSYSQVTKQASLVFRTYLLSPSQVSSKDEHVRSVDFCWGLQDSTLGAAQPAYLSITRATLREFVEPDGTSTNGPVPVDLPDKLFDVPFHIGTNTAGSHGCKTISPASPPLVRRGGYLALDVQVGFTAPNAANSTPFQGWLYFGRVTTTYTP